MCIRDRKLLANIDELYKGELKNTRLVYQDPAYNQVMNKQSQFGEKVIIEANKLPSDSDWIRVSADVSFDVKEWERWKMSQFVVHVKNGSDMVEDYMYRIQKIMDAGSKNIHLDLRYPDEPFTAVEIFFWNSEGEKEIKIHTLKVVAFNE